MERKIDRLSLYDLWFLVPFVVWLFFQTLTTSFFQIYIDGEFITNLNFIVFFIIFVRELFLIHTISKKEIALGLIVLFFIYSFYEYYRDSSMFLLFFIFAARNTKKELVLYTVLVTVTIAFFTIIISSQLGIITDYLEINPNRIRYYLGFKYSLYGPCIFFNIVAIFIYLRKTRMTFLSFFILMSINIFLYIKTDSRLSFLITLLLILIAMALKYLKLDLVFSKRTDIYLLFFLTSIFFIGFGFVISYRYSSNIYFLSKINDILGNRLQLGKNAINTFGFSLFGRGIEFTGNGLNMYGYKSNGYYNYVDNFYIHYAIQYGLLFLGLITMAISSLIISAKRKKDLYLALIVSVFAMKGFIDDLMLPLYYNSFFALSVYYMVGEKENSKLIKSCMLIILLLILIIFINRFMAIFI